MCRMNLFKIIEFDNRNHKQNISRTAYRSDHCLYAKRTGGHHLTDYIKHSYVALIQTEI